MLLVLVYLKYCHLFEQVVEESIMSIEEAIIENLRVLPSQKQQEVLDFVEFLKAKRLPKVSRRSIKGLCADLGVRITEEDIAQARHEMWGNFPKENVL